MKTMNKTLFAIAALVAISSAQAQSLNFSASNFGQIGNTVATHASSTGQNASSSSYATGAAGASASSLAVVGTANGNGSTVVPVSGVPVKVDGDLHVGGAAISGTSASYNTGAAANVSTRGATGSASTTGYADAGSASTVNYSNYSDGAHQYVNLSGQTDSGWYNNVLNGTDIAITAGKNQGSSGEANTAGTYTATGYVGSIAGTANGSYGPVTGQATGAYVFGSVDDSKTSTASISTGKMNLNGTTFSNAPVYVNAGNVTNVTGNFGDPVGSK